MNFEIVLEEAKKGVKESAYWMKKGLDDGQQKDVLVNSNKMLEHLKVDAISPKDYYILFMAVFDELMILEQGFRDIVAQGKRKMVDIYQACQESKSIIPRLYLMVTCGSVLVDSGEKTADQVVKDLFHYLKGVQHPFRGLFLRYYFLKMFKGKIPQYSDNYMEKIKEQFGSIENIVQVLLDNLAEMNRLWIRINSLVKDKKKKLKERSDLKITVGENIHRLSTIEGVTPKIYSELVLPSILDHLVSVKDSISQQYLMDCIIHAFPDEYHLQNLEALLGCVENQSKKCDIKQIYISLMERFAEYSKAQEEEPEEKTNEDGDPIPKKTLSEMTFIYDMFRNSISNLVEKSDGSENLGKLLELLAAFINFSVHSYPTRIDYVNEILKLTKQLCAKSSTKPEEYGEEVLNNITRILTHPLEKMAISVQNMSEFPNLMNHLPFDNKKQVAISICEAIINTKTYLINSEIIEKLIPFILPLLENEAIRPTFDNIEKEQNLISKLLQYLDSHDPVQFLRMLEAFEGYFNKGYCEKKKFTLPALLGRYSVLMHRVSKFNKIIAENTQTMPVQELEHKTEDQGQVETPEGEGQVETPEGEQPVEAPEIEVPKVVPEPVNPLNFVTEYAKEHLNLLDNAAYLSEEEKERFDFSLSSIDVTVLQLAEKCKSLIDELAGDFPDLSITLGQDLAVTFSSCDNIKEGDDLQYSICNEILERYEDEINETKDKIYYLQIIIAAVYNIHNMSDENIDNIIRNVRTYASSFLRKKDSCLMLLKASHLYARPGHIDNDNIKACFNKALQFAENSTKKSSDDATVYVNILNQVMWFYDNGIEAVNCNHINVCCSLAKESMDTIVDPELKTGMKDFLRRTLGYLKLKKSSDTSGKYSDIEV